MTINSQPRVNACSSVDDVHGWGGPGGVVFQKGYVEFFCSPAHLEAVKGALAAHPSVQYMATNEKGEVPPHYYIHARRGDGLKLVSVT